METSWPVFLVLIVGLLAIIGLIANWSQKGD